MTNVTKIKLISRSFHFLFSALLFAVPLYYVIYWAFLNMIPETLITVNMDPAPLVSPPLSIGLRLTGFLASLLPLSALIYGIMNIRKLFAFYREGLIFSFEHVNLFKKISMALIFWVCFSIVYESAKSILFSISNPPGQRILSVGFSSSEMTTLVVAGIVFVIAWVMDEGRIITEEQQLTV